MKEHYTAEEIARALGVSVRAVQKRGKAEKWSHIAQIGGRRGRGSRLFVASRLPLKIQEAIRDWEILRLTDGPAPVGPEPPQASGANATWPSASVDLLQPQAPGLMATVSECLAAAQARLEARRRNPQPLPAGLSERAKQVGLARYQLVQAWRDAVSGTSRGEREQATEAFLAAYHCGGLLPRVLGILGRVTRPTLYRWDKKLREAEDDFVAVTDSRDGCLRGGSRRRTERRLSETAQRALLRCWLQPNRPSVTTAIRAARVLLEHEGVREPASDRTFRRWLRDYVLSNQHVVVLAREGEKAYKDKIGAFVNRDPGALSVGDCLVADGHDLNFFIRHPHTGRPARMKLIVFYDWASRYPAGWQIMPTESSVAIHAALRRAVITLGKVPRAVYLDNGKAFKAKVFTETDVDLQECVGLYGRLGIAVVTAMPYEARAKIVERFFSTLSDQFEAVLPSYCGASIERKPAWQLRNERLHRAWHEAKFQGWMPDIREAAHMLERYVDWYVSQPHRGLGGKTPKEVFDAGKGPGVDEMALGWEFLWRETKRPRRCRIRMWGIDYEGDCLHGLDGQQVVVFYDAADLSRMWVCGMEGRLLGEISPVQAVHPLARLFGGEVAVDQVKAALERQRRLRKRTVESLRELGVVPEELRQVVDAPWGMAAVVRGRECFPAPDGVAETDGAMVCEGNDSLCLDGERAGDEVRLQLVYDGLGAGDHDGPASPDVDRPEWWASEPERYEWCWRAKHVHGVSLGAEDEAFMVYYEQTDVFRTHFAERYAQLAELYGVV